MSETVSLKKYLEKIIELNDRRYTEVNIEKEKALKIKEEADKVALGLARDIQRYKDEKANELREQINSERGLYVTNEKFDTTIKPLVDYVSSQNGKDRGLSMGWAIFSGIIFIIMTAIAIYGFIT